MDEPSGQPLEKVQESLGHGVEGRAVDVCTVDEDAAHPSQGLGHFVAPAVLVEQA